MSNNCNPCTEEQDVGKALPSCQDMMAAALSAYQQLLMGQQVVSVGFGEQRVQYSQSSISGLKEHIKNLHFQCPCKASSAVLGLGGAGSMSVKFGCAAGVARCGR